MLTVSRLLLTDDFTEKALCYLFMSKHLPATPLLTAELLPVCRATHDLLLLLPYLDFTSFASGFSIIWLQMAQTNILLTADSEKSL